MHVPSVLSSRRFGWFLPSAVLVVATVAIVVAHGFAGLYGQDSFGYVNYALGPLRESLLHGGGLPAWPQPPGFPVVIAVISLLIGPDGRVGQAVSLFAGTLVPLLTAVLAFEAVGTRLGGRSAIGLPLVAGLVAGVTGQLWQSSVVAMSDTLSVALATTGAWAVLRYGRIGRSRWLFLAAAATAAAIDTRWVDGLVAVPIAVVGLVALAQTWRRDRPTAVRDALVATILVAAVLAPVLVPMGAAIANATVVPFAADFGAYHWDPFNAVRNAFETTDGRLTYGPTSGAFYLGQPVAPYWFGPAGLFALWGAAWTVGRAGPRATILLVGWPILVLVFLAGSPYQNTRFFLSAMPPVAILVATGLWRLALSIDARLPATRRAPALLLGRAIATVWLVVALAVAGGFTASFIDRQAADLQAIRTLERRVPAGARLLSMGPTGVFVYDRVPDVVELFGLDPAGAVAILDDGRPSYLVIDPAAIEGQWAGRDPARTVEAIRSARGLAVIATAGGWMLYRIGPAPLGVVPFGAGRLASRATGA